MKHFAAIVGSALSSLLAEKPAYDASSTQPASSLLRLSTSFRLWAAALESVRTLLAAAAQQSQAECVDTLYAAACDALTRQSSSPMLNEVLQLPPSAISTALPSNKATSSLLPPAPSAVELSVALFATALQSATEAIHRAVASDNTNCGSGASLLHDPPAVLGSAESLRLLQAASLSSQLLRDSASLSKALTSGGNGSAYASLPLDDLSFLRSMAVTQASEAALWHQLLRWYSQWLARVAQARGRTYSGATDERFSAFTDSLDGQRAWVLPLLLRICGRAHSPHPAVADAAGRGRSPLPRHPSSSRGSRGTTASSPAHSNSSMRSRLPPAGTGAGSVVSRSGNYGAHLLPPRHHSADVIGIRRQAGALPLMLVDGAPRRPCPASACASVAASGAASYLHQHADDDGRSMLSSSASVHLRRGEAKGGVRPHDRAHREWETGPAPVTSLVSSSYHRGGSVGGLPSSGASVVSSSSSSIFTSASSAWWNRGGNAAHVRRGGSGSPVRTGGSSGSGRLGSPGKGSAHYDSASIGGSAISGGGGGGSPSGKSLFISSRDRRAAAAADARAVKALAQRRDEEEAAARAAERNAELLRQATAAAAEAQRRRASRQEERTADALLVGRTVSAGSVGVSLLDGTEDGSGDISTATSKRPKTSVRVTQPAGGASSLSGPAVQHAIGDNDVTATHPAAAAAGIDNTAASTSDEQQQQQQVKTSVRVTQPSGGASSVQNLLYGGGDSESCAASTFNTSAGRNASAAGISSGNHSISSGVAITRPAGDHSTAQELLYPAAIDTNAATPAAAASSTGAASSAAPTGDGGESAAFASMDDSSASARKRRILGRLNSSRALPQAAVLAGSVEAASGSDSAAAPEDAASAVPETAPRAYQPLHQPLPSDTGPSSVDASQLASLPDVFSSVLGGQLASALFGAASATIGVASEAPDNGSSVATVSGNSSGTQKHSSTPTDVHPSLCYRPVLLTTPLPVVVREAVAAPLLRHVRLRSSAAVLCVLLTHDLPGHLAALQSWMLLGQGHVFTSMLQGWMPAVRSLLDVTSGDDVSRSGGSDARAANRNTVAAGITSPSSAVGYASSCFDWALTEHGLRRQAEEYERELSRRVRLARHAASSTTITAEGAASEDANNAAREGSGYDGSRTPYSASEANALLRQEAAANCDVPPAIVHLSRFSYVLSTHSSPSASTSDLRGNASSASTSDQHLLCATDLLRPVYRLSDDADVAQRQVESDEQPSSLLERLLTPAVLARYEAIHSFLLRLRCVALELTRAWRTLTVVSKVPASSSIGDTHGATKCNEAASRLLSSSSSSPSLLLLFRQEASLFVSALEGYLAAQLHGCPSCVSMNHASASASESLCLGHRLASDPSCATFEGLCEAVETLSRDMTRRCLVPEPPSAVIPSRDSSATRSGGAAAGSSSGSSRSAAGSDVPMAKGAALLQSMLGDILQACRLVEAAPVEAPVGDATTQQRISQLRSDFRRRLRLLCIGLESLAQSTSRGREYSHVGDLLERLQPLRPLQQQVVAAQQ